MLACARIGAIHSVVFGGFSPDALAQRIDDAKCVCRRGRDHRRRRPARRRKVPLKANTDKALKSCDSVHTVFVVKRTGGQIDWNDKPSTSGTTSDQGRRSPTASRSR